MIPTSESASTNADPQSPRPAPLLAHQMYDKLRRISDERKLNLSAEDVLISAYLGSNLVYRQAIVGSVSGADRQMDAAAHECEVTAAVRMHG